MLLVSNTIFITEKLSTFMYLYDYKIFFVPESFLQKIFKEIPEYYQTYSISHLIKLVNN